MKPQSIFKPDDKECPECFGDGRIEHYQSPTGYFNDPNGKYVTITCPECGGYGEIEKAND